MKPRRLDPLELTDEDREVNYVFCVARGLSEFRGAVLCLSEDADRRDADLMFRAQQNRQLLWLDDLPGVYFRGVPTGFYKALQSAVSAGMRQI